MSLSVETERKETLLILNIPTEGKPVLASEPRPGDNCPQCKAGTIDYDGMLNLSCEKCGFSLAGCFT